MSRVIKFRAWDKHLKKMGIVTSITFSVVQHTLVRYRYVDDYGKTIDEQSHVDDNGHGVVTLLQFTGLHDKNGVEIYEGDIVHLSSEHGINYKALIIFKDGGFCAIDGPEDDHSVRRYGLMRFELDVEVIGNIYENPELLEVAQ